MKSCVLSCLVLAGLGLSAFLLLPGRSARGHCQVPCGIYDDPGRIQAMLEDATTITKAVAAITELSGKHDPLSFNQATRWINTKEQHASHIITTVSEYFLTQKVAEVAPGAEGYPKYLDSLAVHHRVMRAAMKAKQTVDPQSAAALQKAIEELGALYPGK